MAREISAGGVVYHRDQGKVYLLMIKDGYGRWTLPKGLMEPGETPEESAVREIQEETGIRGRVETKLGDVNYFYRDRERGLIFKTVHYFLVQALDVKARPLLSEIRDVKWLPGEESLQFNDYENNRSILEKALQILASGGFDGGRGLM